jgi:two-component system sensor histidine kinase SenX3
MSALTILIGAAVAVAAFVAGRWSLRRSEGDVSDTAAVATPDDEVPSSPEVEAAEARQLFDRLSQAVDQIEQGVIVFDAAGADVFRNRVAKGFTEARDGLALVEAAVQELVAEALEGRHARREVDLFGPPAQSFVVAAYPFGQRVGTGALVLVDDRSLQRRTETVRRDFVANISHELKTPIGALGLLAETIRDEPDAAVVARLAERMIAEADRAGCTVDDLLELSRIEFGDDAEFSDVGVATVVSEALGRLGSAAEQAGVEVRIDIDPALTLVGDRRQLVSAVFNLLDNAVKYSPEDSEILVDAHRIDERRQLVLTITDHGVGIPRRDLDRIFERFYRVDRARSRGTGGTGLGLAIVRHVASNHGGDVTVESTEGVGSTFTLMIPITAGGAFGAASNHTGGT